MNVIAHSPPDNTRYRSFWKCVHDFHSTVGSNMLHLWLHYALCGYVSDLSTNRVESVRKEASDAVSQCDYPFLPFLFCFSFDVCQPVGVQANTMHESCIRLSEPKKHPTFCWMSQVFCYFLRAGDCGSALFCLFYSVLLVLILHTHTSSCLMSLPRWCHQPKESAQNTNSRWRETVLRDYYTLVRLTNLKQLQMQPFKHPCTLWGIHLQDIVLPWQKSSFHTYKI